MKLGSDAHIKQFDTIDSTSLEAKRLIEAGQHGPLWVLAERQTAGYGRRGTAWQQASGDVAASLIFPIEPEVAAQAAELSYAAALAVADAMEQYVGDAAITVKWPNDVLLAGAKVSGLLLELLTPKPTQPVLVLGVGVNIVSTPESVPYPVAKMLDHTSAAPTPLEMVSKIDAAFFRYYQKWQEDGFTALRDRWLSRAARLHETILVRCQGEVLEGVFKNVDEDGSLVLATSEGERLITAGEVFFRRICVFNVLGQ